MLPWASPLCSCKRGITTWALSHRCCGIATTLLLLWASPLCAVLPRGQQHCSCGHCSHWGSVLWASPPSDRRRGHRHHHGHRHRCHCSVPIVGTATAGGLQVTPHGRVPHGTAIQPRPRGVAGHRGTPTLCPQPRTAPSGSSAVALGDPIPGCEFGGVGGGDNALGSGGQLRPGTLGSRVVGPGRVKGSGGPRAVSLPTETRHEVIGDELGLGAAGDNGRAVGGPPPHHPCAGDSAVPKGEPWGRHRSAFGGVKPSPKSP